MLLLQQNESKQLEEQTEHPFYYFSATFGTLKLNKRSDLLRFQTARR